MRLLVQSAQSSERQKSLSRPKKSLSICSKVLTAAFWSRKSGTTASSPDGTRQPARSKSLSIFKLMSSTDCSLPLSTTSTWTHNGEKCMLIVRIDFIKLELSI